MLLETILRFIKKQQTCPFESKSYLGMLKRKLIGY